ncbi:MAG: hypothetical protein HY482_02590 [Candidatus Wildermuthbacteria bacterium]|nr:hypothetical protein [Candidatus Wildermuthbacteria bacterium]
MSYEQYEQTAASIQMMVRGTIIYISGGVYDIFRGEGSQRNLQLLINSFPTLAERAAQARKHAVSYRGFHVGCAALASNPEEKGADQTAIFLGCNEKTASDAQTVCAERVAVQSALAWGYRHIVAIAIEGPPQEDHGSGIKSPTLHPCKDCRAAFQYTPNVSPNTYIITLNPMSGQGQICLFRELILIHHGPNHLQWHALGRPT